MVCRILHDPYKQDVTATLSDRFGNGLEFPSSIKSLVVQHAHRENQRILCSWYRASLYVKII